MHVLNLALDPKTLDPESVVAFRNRAYGATIGQYSIIVPSPATITVQLSDVTTAYGISGLHKLVQLFRMYLCAESLFRVRPYVVVTTQDMYFLGLLGMLLARRHHLGLEVQVLGIEKLTPLRRRVALFVLRHASVVRALSVRLKNRLMTEFGVPEEKIVVVPIYVDVQKLGLDVRTLGIEDTKRFEALSHTFRENYGTKFNFLTVSRLVPIKQIKMQLATLAKLVVSYPDVMLHIVGDGPDEMVLKEQVTTLGLEEHVILHGYQSGFTLGMFYLECDSFLLTSDYEGWGMVIVEALTAGLPVIMTDVGCAGELVFNEESGLIVTPGDVVALSMAMERMVRDSELRNRLSENALRTLAQLPHFEVILEQYKKNWERALACPL